MTKRVEDEIKLEDVRLMWRNFAGEAKLYNDAGKRNFAIPLDEELALQLQEIGWNVKAKEKELDGKLQTLYHLSVTVKMDGRIPPRMFMITKKWSEPEQKEVTTRTALDEDTVMLLDYAEFDSVDVIIRPYNWKNARGESGVAAYLKTLFAILHQDDLEKKYAHIPIEGELDALEIENIIDVEGEWVDDEQPALPRGNS